MHLIHINAEPQFAISTTALPNATFTLEVERPPQGPVIEATILRGPGTGRPEAMGMPLTKSDGLGNLGVAPYPNDSDQAQTVVWQLDGSPAPYRALHCFWDTAADRWRIFLKRLPLSGDFDLAQIRPHDPRVVVVSKQGIVADPWQSLHNGTIHVARAVRHGSTIDHFQSIAHFPIEGGSIVTFRLPLATHPLVRGQDPQPSSMELSISGDVVWKALGLEQLEILFVTS
ncbi:MAG: hypothetical protein AAGE52_31480 [Myxococcota bacterium]